MAYLAASYIPQSHNPISYGSLLEYKVTVSNSESSQLESNVVFESNTPNKTTQNPYNSNPYSALYGMISSKPTITYISNNNDFLNPLRPQTRFIEKLDAKLKEIIEKTFRFIFNQDFPDDIAINICTKEQLIKAHALAGGNSSSTLLGFAINRKSAGQISEIFILNDELDRLLITIGHELGHILSPSLSNIHDEEAKAFAFQHHWIKTIIENNIGGLENNFILGHRPANNGIHDKAFYFVQNMLKTGLNGLEIFKQIITKNLGVIHG